MTSQKIQNNETKVENSPDEIQGMTFVICKLRTTIGNRYLSNPVRVDLLYRRSGIVALNRRCVLALHRIRRLQVERQELT